MEKWIIKMENHETTTPRQTELPTLRFRNKTPTTPDNENKQKTTMLFFEPSPRTGRTNKT